MESTIQWYKTNHLWWKQLKNEKFWEYFKEIYGSI